MLVVPVVVLQALGTVEVGFYRAAMAVSVGLTALFAVGIHQDFLPRISAAIGPDEQKSLIEKRMRIVIGIGLPALLVLLASAPLLIEVLYASEFRPALTILRWQLVGDMIRLPAIVLATAALGVGSRSLYFSIESLGGFAFVVGAVLAIGTLGLAGVGVAYAAAQAMTFAAGWLVMRARLKVVPGRLQVVVVITTVGSCLVVLADPAPAVITTVFLLAGLVGAILAWKRLVPLHRQRAL